MPTVMLPPVVNQILPALQALDSEQKLLIIKELLNESRPVIETSPFEDNKNLAWEMGKDIFGSYHSGKNNLSSQAKNIVRERIRQKYGKNSD